MVVAAWVQRLRALAGPRQELDLLEVHRAHADFVWRTLQRLGVHGADLEDALQEVFLVVHRRLHSFDGSSQLTTWLFAICQRVAAAQRRRAHRRHERPSDLLDAELGGDLNHELDEAIAATEARRRFETVLEGVAPERRVVFVMFEIEAIPCTEIAATLGLPVGTVYSRLSAARAEFAKAAERLKLREAREGKP